MEQIITVKSFIVDRFASGHHVVVAVDVPTRLLYGSPRIVVIRAWIAMMMIKNAAGNLNELAIVVQRLVAERTHRLCDFWHF